MIFNNVTATWPAGWVRAREPVVTPEQVQTINDAVKTLREIWPVLVAHPEGRRALRDFLVGAGESDGTTNKAD